MLGYLRCKLGGGGGEGSISNIANAYIQKSMVRICGFTPEMVM